MVGATGRYVTAHVTTILPISAQDQSDVQFDTRSPSMTCTTTRFLLFGAALTWESDLVGSPVQGFAFLLSWFPFVNN